MIELPTTLLDWLQLIAQGAAVAGIFYAAVFFWANERTKRRNEMFAISDRANAPFRQFLELHLEYPELGLTSDVRVDRAEMLKEHDLQRQKILFDFLISITENVYYLCDKGKPLHGEWPTWENWYQQYKLNPNFMRCWNEANEQGLLDAYGPEFISKLHEILGTSCKPDGRPQRHEPFFFLQRLRKMRKRR